MTSEEQHYAAKIFLKAYGDALKTIQYYEHSTQGQRLRTSQN